MNSRCWPGLAWMFFAALLLSSFSVNAQISGIRADNDPTDVAAINELELLLCDLLVHGDWQRYATYLTDDYVRVLPGKIQSKAEVLDGMRVSPTKLISMIPEKVQVRIFGDTAIAIIDLATRHRAPDGTISESHGRPTKVFVRRNGRWYLAQLTTSSR
jgi:ketosteroid isomerase-like protein